ncbi:MAG: hypothetical protein MZW92_51130 [Comamonadaceae bacterium]|nr:hypothetical protein [Comamonadaceae bacterium]
MLPDRGAGDDGRRTSCAPTSQLAHPDLPPPRRPRDGRHGGADPDQERPGGQRGGARQGARRQAARGRATATTAPGSRTRAWCRSRREVFDAHMPAPNQIARACARTCSVTAARPARGARRDAITETGLRHNIDVGIQYLEAWLARQRLRADLQPDGGRRDRRDLARAGVAVARSHDAACSTTAAR